jgi:hypothetical protein
MIQQAQVAIFPATRHPYFAHLSTVVGRVVHKHVNEIRDRLMRIAAAEYSALLGNGMPEDVAMERADDLLCCLLEAAEHERHKLLVEIAFANP